MTNRTKSETVGLCVTCNNSRGCVLRAKRGFDAIYCETFDACVPAAGDGHNDDETTLVSGSEQSAHPELRGLCVNCGNRETCTLPKPEGGVWHCEEYC